MTEQTLHFSIEGAFITKFARELLYERHDLDKAISYLKDCTLSDELSETEHIKLIMDILRGKADIVGTYPGEDYGIECHDDLPEEKLNPSIGELMNQMQKTIDELKQKNEQLLLQRNFLYCELFENTPYTLKEYMTAYETAYDEPFLNAEEQKTLGYPDTLANHTLMALNKLTGGNTSLLDSFMERIHQDLPDDYGWLHPNGTFYPVDFGEHEAWAGRYIEENYPDEYESAMSPQPESKDSYHSYGDFLVYRKNFCLLDNPAQGLARVTCNPARNRTKAQKEFLFDYYTKRNHPEIAKLYFDEDE